MNEFGKIKSSLDRFVSIPDDEWKNFVSGLKVKQVKKGDILTDLGQIEHYIYFLNQGATRNFFIQDGKEFTVDFHFENSFVTAYYSFITREPSQVSIEMLADGEVVMIPYEWLHRYYKQSIYGERIGRLMAESQYVNRLNREMSLLSLTAEERYAELMQKNPVLVNTISIKHLSSYLGIQPESLSRIRRQFGKN